MSTNWPSAIDVDRILKTMGQSILADWLEEAGFPETAKRLRLTPDFYRLKEILAFIVAEADGATERNYWLGYGNAWDIVNAGKYGCQIG